MNSEELLNGPPCLIYFGFFETFFCSIMWKIFNLGIKVFNSDHFCILSCSKNTTETKIKNNLFTKFYDIFLLLILFYYLTGKAFKRNTTHRTSILVLLTAAVSSPLTLQDGTTLCLLTAAVSTPPTLQDGTTICLLTDAVSSPPTLQDGTALYVYSRLLSHLLQPYRMALHYMSTHGCCLISSNPTG